MGSSHHHHHHGSSAKVKKPELLIFDVNETLLDMGPLENAINESLNSEHAFSLWFRTLLHYSLTETLTGNYVDFGTIGKATLKMTMRKFGKNLSEDRLDAILGNIKKLPAHEDVKEGLKMLKEAQIKLVALSNSNGKLLNAQLQFAGLADYFDAIFSVEAVGRYKPELASYRAVLETMKVPAENTMMVAAHGWDILGAKRAGLRTAFVAREGHAIYPLDGTPELEAKTVLEVARTLLKN
uniref:(S)-2-haloacid dehalogenase n=1 Tax=Zobellia galactanivorans (strain DSM 12802 / CCUG 47099 / CIP 106680 / NCIMB 13871 / Dsij) TaxID=63186 RepID=UPI001CA46E29|nr:Chain A, (S)-2-haloacid dehalogenase [Zobellia galactanivorans]7ARP_B Chain B, (S)-2-haloacid dehalogenase [Zobellia galactanivorans]